MYDKTQIGQQLGVDMALLSHDIRLMLTLMISTGNYITNRINNQGHRTAYKLAMDQYIEAAKSLESLTDLSIRHSEILANVKIYIKPTWFSSRTSECKYYTMACHHAADIINSIDRRFKSGGFDTESRKHKHKEPIAILSSTKLFSEAHYE